MDDWDKEQIVACRYLNHILPAGNMFESGDWIEYPFMYLDIWADGIAKNCSMETYGVTLSNGGRVKNLDNLMSDPVTLHRIFRSIHKSLSDKDTFLDIGCSSGLPVCMGLELGYDCYGVDCNSEILSVVKNSLQNLGHSPNRVVKGDVTSDVFWKTPICGNDPTIFDFYYIHQPASLALELMKVVAKNMNPAAHIIMSYDGGWWNDNRLTPMGLTKYLGATYPLIEKRTS